MGQRARPPTKRLTTTNRRPTSYEKQLGGNMKMLRLRAKMTQAELGEKLGVSFQQIQKYEMGRNRLNAEKLSKIAEAFHVSIQTLMDVSASPTGNGAPVIDKQAFLYMEQFLKLAPSLRLCLINLIAELPKKPEG